MTIYIKNLTDKQVKIKTLKLALNAGKTRKIIADFEDEFQSTKAELERLVDDKEIEIIDSKGSTITTSNLFSEITNKMKNEEQSQLNTEELSKERFYYLEDHFCVEKFVSIQKPFKGKAENLTITAKYNPVRLRIKADGVTMPWQYIKTDKEMNVTFDGKLVDPTIEVMAGSGNAVLSMYIDGTVQGTSADSLQGFINTWFEEENTCENYEWGNESAWWNENKDDLSMTDKNWDSKTGEYLIKKINVQSLSGTELKHKRTGSELIIPAKKENVSGETTSEFKIFKTTNNTFIVEKIAYNQWSSWNPNAFFVELKNTRYVVFDDVTVELETDETIEMWKDRWQLDNYYLKSGLKFLTESSSFSNVVGVYEKDNNGNPINPNIVLYNDNQTENNTPLTTLDPNKDYDFFIVSNGSGTVAQDSVLDFDNSTEYPVLKVDGTSIDENIFFSDKEFNADGKSHFRFVKTESGTDVKIEDLFGQGDFDFNDVVLNVNFELTTKINETENESKTISDYLKEHETFSCETEMDNINLYSMGTIEKEDDYFVFRLRNGKNENMDFTFKYGGGRHTKYKQITLPSKTEHYFLISEDEVKGIHSELFWEENQSWKSKRIKNVEEEFETNKKISEQVQKTV